MVDTSRAPGSHAAHRAAFKSKTEALIDTLRLSHAEVVDLGIALTVSHAAAAGIDDADLRGRLEEHIKAAPIARREAACR